jgi:hypothetical protein
VSVIKSEKHLQHMRGYVWKMWQTPKRGGLNDFEEFFSRVLLRLHEEPTRMLRHICLNVLRDMNRDLKRDAELAADLSFQSQRPSTGDVLPADFQVPTPKQHGGARKGAGRPRKKPEAA